MKKTKLLALAREWEGIANELAEDTSKQEMVVLQIRAREIQLCRWHAKQLRKALRGFKPSFNSPPPN